MKIRIGIDNLSPYHLEEKNFVASTLNAYDIQNMGEKTEALISADITTSFTVLVGIFFPSVTGK